MLLQALVQLVDTGKSEHVRVRNISSGGLMAEGELAVAQGDRLRVELRGVGVTAGRVAWARKGRFGVQFDETIDPSLTRKKLTTPTTMVIPAYGTKRRPGFGKV